MSQQTDALRALIKDHIQPGDIIQITNERPGLAGCLAMVTEKKSFGCQCFIAHCTSFEEPPSQIYLRLNKDQYEYIGPSVMMPNSMIEEQADDNK